MTRIESDQVSISQNRETVYNYLSDVNNFKNLMPEQVTDWVSDADSCSFNIKGMATLGMAVESRDPENGILLKRSGKAPFDFILNCVIGEGANAGTTLAQIQFDADLNPMLRMMAEKPLTNFLNMLVNKLKEISEAAA